MGSMEEKMFKIISKMTLPITFALGITTAAHADTYVVLNSQGVELTQGTQIQSGEMLTLSPNASVTLLNNSGTVREITGPFQGTLNFNDGGEETSRAFAALQSLFARSQTSTASVGAVRAAFSTQSSVDDYRHAPMERSGVVCYDETLLLERASETSTDLVLDKNYIRATTKLNSDDKVVEVIDRFVADGELLTVKVGGRTFSLEPREVTFTGNTVEDAALLAENNCDVQALAALKN